MSLIQEALKRQQEEADKSSVGIPPATEEWQSPGPGEGQSVPPPLPQPPAAPPRSAAAPETGKRAWPALLGVVALLVALVGGAVWMLYFVYEQFVGGEPEAMPVEITTVDPTDVEPPPDSATPPDDPGDEAVEPEPGAQPDSAAEPDTAATPPESGTDEPAPDGPQGDEPPDAPLPDIPWPALRVEGVVGTGAKGAAMLNGQIIRVGERIQGVTVQSVGKQGVVLEYKGRTRTIRAGGSTQ